MPTALQEFKKNKKFLLCIDSDGCAMDTMTVKHVKCFGPCFTDEWGITEGREKVLKRWNDINLYEKSRGINRFKGLAQILSELYPNDTNVEGFRNWTDTAHELSEAAVNGIVTNGGNEIFKKALAWSKAVNRNINLLSEADKTAFNGVKEALERASKFCDVAIVSSANYAAVVEEWERCGILGYTDVVTTQSDGSKAYCIKKLLEKGFDNNRTLMCGDAIGDLDAARQNNIYFYPILAGKETDSWSVFNEFLNKFIDGTYSTCATRLLEQFNTNFNN